MSGSILPKLNIRRLLSCFLALYTTYILLVGGPRPSSSHSACPSHFWARSLTPNHTTAQTLHFTMAKNIILLNWKDRTKRPIRTTSNPSKTPGPSFCKFSRADSSPLLTPQHTTYSKNTMCNFIHIICIFCTLFVVLYYVNVLPLQFTPDLVLFL